ncbi:hypothetical protein QJS10_CPA06g01193 [Acorus calamus]|uniref:Uncharacterized protein n=1 Tax=Acorus calamus TaxID=4465 RepID=A0AAV9EI01_ACOCL|nr:hypothetical protein QJS10_CPA06g01193 [Acorus calamus]
MEGEGKLQPVKAACKPLQSQCSTSHLGASYISMPKVPCMATDRETHVRPYPQDRREVREGLHEIVYPPHFLEYPPFDIEQREKTIPKKKKTGRGPRSRGRLLRKSLYKDKLLGRKRWEEREREKIERESSAMVRDGVFQERDVGGGG